MTDNSKCKVSVEDVIYLKRALAFACGFDSETYEPARLNKIVRALVK